MGKMEIVGEAADALVTVSAVVGDDRGIIEGFIDEVHEVLSGSYQFYELLLIDNGSSDGTSEQIQDIQERLPNIRLIRLSRTYQKEIALAAALDNSIGDYVVIMEVHNDPPSMIPILVNRAVQGFDVVVGKPEGSEKIPLLERWITDLIYRVASKALGYRIGSEMSYSRALSRRAVNSLTRIKSKGRYLRFFSASIGFGQSQVSYRPIRRSGQQAHQRTLVNSILSAIDLLISNSAIPLRMASLVGLAASFLSLLYLGYIFVVTLVKDRIAEGWITTSVTSTTMFLLLFLILTVLSEYIARILEETKDRPLYFVEYETSSSVSIYGPQPSDQELNVV